MPAKTNSTQTSKKQKKSSNELFFWLLLIGFLGVIASVIAYSIMTWKDPPIMIPLVDQIDIGRHNDKPGVTFHRGKNSLFYIQDVDSAKALFQSYFWKSVIPDCPITTELGINIPPEYDFYKAFPQCAGKAQSQGLESTAYALVAGSILSDRICVKTGKRPDINQNYIVTCCPFEKTNDTARKGYVVDALNFANKNGLPLSQCVYEGNKQEICSVKCDKQIPSGSIEEICKISGEERIMREILKNGPVVAEMEVKSDFTTYKSGIYQFRKRTGVYTVNGRHVVKIIGWGQKNGMKFWKIENTWGEDWGENGFANVEMKGIIKEDEVLVVKVKAIQ